jgi:hypothetical protein
MTQIALTDYVWSLYPARSGLFTVVAASSSRPTRRLVTQRGLSVRATSRQGVLHATLVVPEEGEVRLSAFSLEGRRRVVLLSERLTSGTHVLDVRVPAMPGVVCLRAEAGRSCATEVVCAW